jgi:hypothetical protein
MPTIVLIRGLGLHPASRRPWPDHFEAAGHDTLVPEWPGTADTSLSRLRERGM